MNAPNEHDFPATPLRRLPAQASAWRLQLAIGLGACGGTALLLVHAADVPGTVAAYSLFAYALLVGGLLYRSPPVFLRQGPGAANGITLLRAALAAPVSIVALHPGSWDTLTTVWLIGISALVVTLDAVDGAVARRTRRTGAFGARFDMEVDAWLILILSLLVWRTGQAGAWVLLIGLLRYAFVVGGWYWAWLSARLPPSRRRQTVCVLQSLALLAALAPVMPAQAASIVVLAALLSLSYSFAVDVLWLYRHANGAPTR
ncbi:CDP-alcohol phosphatidyltransferase [Thioalkalivibrio nitratireducens DSM 14787]|uniref:CDP-alcohol phosphatidyltransferase n=1 Tax=Thioalkalivibrio nitratireducens (strain DSM 14787 / UNIQEM 213 / ALEN2) TaxID=1255043 RepID=L0DV29_THIND|nr:CDP-alcohol phosphatidyltransferase family protein [Thioalkalivibrio nitratireducens]AGA33454.1 CDP-alcohol phosphatidyltransferase [Thioalkalivibrio nitratireducens DSM 14787]